MDRGLDTLPEAALREHMKRYGDAWNREDVDEILDCYHLPCFIYKYGTLHTLLDAEAKRNYVAGFVEVNRRDGPATWEMASLSLTGMGHNSALATAQWYFRRPDGTLVWDFVDSYQLCRFEGRWKILVRTLHDTG